VRGGAGRGDQNQQRDKGQRGQRGEAQGPLHQLELPAASVEIGEPEVAPESFDAPVHRPLHRPARATARHSRTMVVASSPDPFGRLIGGRQANRH
jgi:hypothetical protein